MTAIPLAAWAEKFNTLNNFGSKKLGGEESPRAPYGYTDKGRREHAERYQYFHIRSNVIVDLHQK